MAVPSTGVVKMSNLRDEFMPVGSNMPVSLGTLYRGGTYVRANAVDNTTVNQAASVPASGIIKFSDFRGTTKGWVSTNAGTITSHNMHTPFGSDWGVDWPKKLVNNGTIGSTDGSNAINILSGALGRIDFVNNGFVRGAGGGPNSGNGGVALRINCNVRVYVTNTNTISGGGGGGGKGGNGGKGGDGYIDNRTFEGYPGIYDGTNSPITLWGIDQEDGTLAIWWNNPDYAPMVRDVAYPPSHQYTVAPWTYVRGNLANANPLNNYDHYYIYRFQGTVDYYTGAAGGAGGNGGVGQGYNGPNTNGAAGAPGANAGGNTGVSGAGGAGGNGGTWGVAGTAGSNGAAGANGNNGSGAAGTAGTAGGSGGYAIYVDTPWTNLGSGIRHGPVGPTAPTAG